MAVSELADIAAFETIPGGWHIKTRDDGERCIDVMQMIYNYRIVLSYPGHRVIEHGWCYFGHGEDADGRPRTMGAALLAAVSAALVWDGYGEPVGYDKQAC